MKTLLISCSLLLTSMMQAQVQVAPIRIRVLNGRNEKPVRRANLIVTEMPAQPYYTPLEQTTDATGRSSLLVQGNIELHTLVLRHPTCRRVSKADRKKQLVGYSTQQILTQGIVSENGCSKRTLKPTPGELILFVRPQHWWERTSY